MSCINDGRCQRYLVLEKKGEGGGGERERERERERDCSLVCSLAVTLSPSNVLMDILDGSAKATECAATLRS